MPQLRWVAVASEILTPLRVSVSQPSVLRWTGVTYTLNGAPADPRSLFVPQFQLLVPGATAFASQWAAGSWETNPVAPSSGPFAATVTIGPGQPAAVNPGAVGIYQLVVRYLGSAESPVKWAKRLIELVDP